MGSLENNLTQKLASQFPMNTLEPEEFRRQGHLMIDFLADYYRKVENYPVRSQVSPGYLREILPESAPYNPESLETILQDVQTKIIPGITHWQSPNFFAYFPSSGSTAGFLGEMLSTGFNVVGFNWMVSPAATELENVVTDWFGKMLQLPKSFLFSGGGGGVLQGTTCEAILCTLVAARDKNLRQHGMGNIGKLVVYCSDQTHSALQKAAKIAGIDPMNFRVIETSKSSDFKLCPKRLESAILYDMQNGLIPLYLCATVGTTSSTTVDPLPALTEVAKKYELWVHVDAAYAGSACICPEFRQYLDGVENADSFSLNAHKWFLTTLDCCCLWVKDPSALIKSLSTYPEFLKNNASETNKVVDYKDWQIMLSRRFRALKLWFVLRSYGVGQLREFIRGHVGMAKYFEGLVTMDNRFEVVAPRLFSMVCFRIKPSAMIGKNDEKEVNEINRKLLESVNDSAERYKAMLESRAKLPIAELKDDILRLLKENNVLVVCGETGCGKTTQVPQFILDDMIEVGRGGHCNIICTQPRRIAAISVAERVADERCESSPGSNDSLVGYQVRLDSARNERTKLLFCTTGILLRKFAGDKNMADLTHVIVDEVHERSLLGDFLLIVLKKLIEKQSKDSIHKLKVILMSATVDSQMFSRYFGNCPVITAEGRTHPVSTCFLEDIHESLSYRLASDSPASIRNETSKQKGAPVTNHRGKKNLVLSGWGDEALLYEDSINPYYEPTFYGTYSEQTRQNLKRLNEDVIDYDLLEDMVCHIDETSPEGAILVFLPGVSEINLLHDKLAASYRFRGPSAEWILPLHSSIASEDQRKVFSRPPNNIRKVIIATNIAETSITIDDVVYVVDCGKHKENRYNPQKKLTSMVEDWISQANARQRRGRAGRVKPGSCFCLYTRHRFDHLMRPFQQPEMLRMPLVELCLQIKLLSLGNIRLFLSEALEPPKEEAITSAISLLYEVGAIEGDEELTPLGYHLAKLPVDVLIGKMMLYGGIFGCLSPILSISAFLSYKSPFVYPKDERQTVERAKLALLTDKVGVASDSDNNNKQSDHLVMMVAYRKWEKILRESGGKAAQRFCSSYFLSSSVMYMIRDMRIQFGTLLADIGLISLPKTYQMNGTRKDVLDSWFSDMSEPFNMNSNHFSVVRAILCAGLYPNVAAMEEGIAGTALGNLKHSVGSSSHGRPVWYDGKREVHIHPSSINSNLRGFQYPFLVFLEKVETNRVFLRDTTIISPYSILLFGGSINLQHQTGLVIIDGWLKLKAPAQTAVLFKELRATLHSILKELIGKPQTRTLADNEVMRSIIHLLLEEDKPVK